MKKNFLLVLFLASLFSFNACSEDNDPPKEVDPAPEEEKEPTEEERIDFEVKSFIYRGLNDIYLYKADVPELADDYFDSDDAQTDFLNKFNSPEELFNSLLSNQDEFSYLVDDYEELENQFDGISGATGIQFGLGLLKGSNNIFGYIQYILPGTSAAEAGLSRGDIFTEVDGEQLTLSNFNELLTQDSFTINIGYVENNAIYLTDETATLTDDYYTMNPVFITKVFEIEGRKIGYLMYNSFIANFDEELNAAFGEFKSKNVTDLVLDLRYNGGGSVNTATDLASMITGQFEGQVFAKEQWNKDYQEYYETYTPDFLINEFDSELSDGQSINSLNLNEIYILSTQATASASELIINGLTPYINVVHIGETTTGKFQASITLYDSPTFNDKNRNEDHTYAMQPLVLKMANKDGYTDFKDGLIPDIIITEDLENMGVLGDPEEPYLARAIDEILNRNQMQSRMGNKDHLKFEKIGESDMFKPTYQKMYIDKTPMIKG